MTHKFVEMTPSEQQEFLWRKNKFLHTQNRKRYFDDVKMSQPPYRPHWIAIYSAQMPGLGLHQQGFATAIAGMASEEQKARWLPGIYRAEILGCYAQTELGHGSDVASLETTATFDRETDEFIIHSPTVSSSKFWPGEMGRFSSHALVYAKLIIGKKFFGVHPFLVQLRDLETYKHLKGVKTGDIGPKVGYFSKDNGWARFEQVRIPRTNLMMGFINVDREGNFKKTGDLRVLYTAMMVMRTLIVQFCGYGLQKAVLIGIRYNVMRRQFKTIHGSTQERPILDYQTQRHIYSSLLAKVFVMHVNSTYTTNMFQGMMEEIWETRQFGKMDSTHHILSGFKVIYTDDYCDGAEEARRACGGAGYAAFSGFRAINENASAYPTFEGDNTVMMAQASRYLFKLLAKA